MKQEKKPITWSDITDADNKLQPWQKNAWGKISGGLKKGDMHIISYGRRTGKSQFAAMYMAGSTFFGNGTSTFGSPWGEWKDTFIWPWDRKTSIESNKEIWGRIKVRENKVVWNSGGPQIQYATKKEVFQRKLKGTD